MAAAAWLTGHARIRPSAPMSRLIDAAIPQGHYALTTTVATIVGWMVQW